MSNPTSKLLQSLDVAYEKHVNKDGELDVSNLRQLIKDFCTTLGIEWTDALLDHLVREAIDKHDQNGDRFFSVDELNDILSDYKMAPRLKTRHPKNIVVFGGGAFGTAVSSVLARKGHNIKLLMRDCEAEHVESVNKQNINTMCFPDTKLPKEITATTSLDEAFSVSLDLIVHATPVQFSRSFLKMIKEANVVKEGTPFLTTSKGIEVNSLSFMHEILGELFPNNPVVCLAGPSFAKGLVDGHPTLVTLACSDGEIAQRLQHIVSSPSFRAYTSTDVIGLEVAGALKNVLAISVGLVEGLGMGPNTQCSLITRGWQEVRKLSLAMGGRPETLLGLGGLGDLMMTCYGGLSRNAKFGGLLAKGLSVDEAIKEVGQVVEGFPTAGAAIRLAKAHNVKVPILNALYSVLDGKLAAQDVILFISSLPLHGEFDIDAVDETLSHM